MPREDFVRIEVGRLHGIELKESIPAKYFMKDEAVASEARSGELATAILVFALAAPVATAIAGWLLAGRTSDELTFNYEKRSACGDYERATFTHKLTKVEAADPKFVEALGGIIMNAMRSGAAAV